MTSTRNLLDGLREIGWNWITRGRRTMDAMRRDLLGAQALDAASPTTDSARHFFSGTNNFRRGTAHFLDLAYSSPAGARDYKLYIPSSYRGRPMPLVVMLHGCKQDPDDFARGTDMNTAAEEHGFLVAYPAQSRAVNRMGCWQWYQAEHQGRGSGEPAIIAGITREVMKQYAIDPKRVFVAGLSAGASMAVILGMTYPELYAAVGVHSGLAYGGADNAYAAIFAMRRGAKARRRTDARPTRAGIPTIVFHGNLDRTVHPDNGMQVMQHSAPNSAGGVPPEEVSMTLKRGRSDGGLDYTQTAWQDEDGRTVAEHWLVSGLGHAWSGGDGQGSFTDPQGPSATREMLRFFFGAGQGKRGG